LGKGRWVAIYNEFNMFDAKRFVSGLPNLPGVYRMLGKGGEALYVGKARDLRKRVASYFNKHGHGPRTQLMIGQVDSIEVTATRFLRSLALPT